MIDMHLMTKVVTDPVTRIAHVGGGAL